MPRRDISVEAMRHKDKRRNIPTAELEPVMDERDKSPIRLAYERRNRDLDPQLVWRGKDEQDWSDLIVQAPPLYIQEKVHPKVLIDDLLRQSRERREETNPPMPDLFADFNGLPDKEAVTEFYQHDANWSNRMILGDSLSVMASLAEREGLRGKVQCIYIDPPYGIRFNSNFQWSTASRDVKDGNKDHITREPEQVKAFRDTWREGIHSYLTYLRDRLTVARDLLAESGSIFVQIGDENVHRVRALMDEVFGDTNFVGMCTVRKTTSDSTELLGSTCDFVLWFAKNRDVAKSRTIWAVRSDDAEERYSGEYGDGRRFQLGGITSSRPPGDGDLKVFRWFGRGFEAGNATFKTAEIGLTRAGKADRLAVTSRGKLRYRRFHNDFGYAPIANLWTDISGAVQSRSDPKVYVVQSSTTIAERCVLLATDPGDLVLDPTCGSGTSAYVAEQWGRRWITIDTSRVALALARARIMGARYPYYLLADSPEGQRKEAEVTRAPPRETPTHNDIRQGFVCERVPHITLKSIANNAEIDVIWEKWQGALEPLRAQLNAALGKSWEEWQIPRDAGDPWPESTARLWALAKGNNDPKEIEKTVGAINAALGRNYARDTLPDAPRDPWPEEAIRLHAEWWGARIARQKEIDASIAATAEFEYLYDKPYTDNARIRVAGPFTVENLSPHRFVPGDLDDSLIDELAEPQARWQDFGRWCSKTSNPPASSRRTNKTGLPSPR
jgi:adenine-specific DNA-methyltransferase